MLYNQAIQLPVYPVTTHKNTQCGIVYTTERKEGKKEPSIRHWSHYGTSKPQNMTQQLKMRQGIYWYRKMSKI